MPKKLYSFRFDEAELIEPLKAIAKEEHRDLTNLIEVILMEYVEQSNSSR